MAFNPNEKQIAILGAGPAGLMAAEQLAMVGYQVTIYDRMKSPARKFLIAGRGGLNLTHSEPLEPFLSRYGDAQDWISPYIRAFPPEALRAWCKRMGEDTFVGSSGRVFPRSMKAVQLLRLWLQRLGSMGVRYVPQHTWTGWEGEQLKFSTPSGEQRIARAHATLLALGGASWPRLGSDGSWVSVLSQRNVHARALRPANCGFIVPWSEYLSTRFAGAPLKPVSLSHNGITRQGEAMITAGGMEGGVMYALSAAIRSTLERNGVALVHIDLRPTMSLVALTHKLGAARGNKSFSSYMRGHGFSSLHVALLREVLGAQALAKIEPEALARHIKSLPIQFTQHAGMARAISSAGGLLKTELTPELMIRALPGVFAAGEMLDWEAPTGGYLLQGCFSTAVAAARGVDSYLRANEERSLL